MSTTEHTPGPWRTGRGGADAIYAGTGKHARRIARFYTENAYEDRYPGEPNRDFANARLAASAPELLKAVSLASELCRAQADPEHCLHGKRVDWAALVERFDQVIREVSGEDLER